MVEEAEEDEGGKEKPDLAGGALLERSDFLGAFPVFFFFFVLAAPEGCWGDREPWERNRAGEDRSLIGGRIARGAAEPASGVLELF